MARFHCPWRNVFIAVCTPCACLLLLNVCVVVMMMLHLNTLTTQSEGFMVAIRPHNSHFVASGVLDVTSYAPLPKTFWNQQGQKALWSQLQLVVDRHLNPILHRRKATREQSAKGLSTSLLWQSFSEETFLNNTRNNFNELPRKLQRFVRYMQRRDYPVLLQPSGDCGAKGKKDNKWPLLLFAIKTKEMNFEYRQAIRQTWGRVGWVRGQWANGSKEEGGGYIRRVFLLGRRDTREKGVDASNILEMESKHFGDMLQWDFEDTFFNLTLKDVLLWRWFSESCGQTAFVFKGDDDVFVNTPKMVAYLLDQLKKPQGYKTMRDFMVGDVIVAASPNRDKTSKYFIPEIFYSGYYPRYLGGGGVVYSGLVTKRLHQVSQRVHLYPIDDVYVGMCMLRLNALPIHHPAFLTFDFPAKEKAEPCPYHTVLLVHKRSPSQLVKLWANVTMTRTACQHVPLRSDKNNLNKPKSTVKSWQSLPGKELKKVEKSLN